jgi:hypothetical protein
MVKLTTPLTTVDSEQKFTPGSRTITKDGNEYIYLKGVASVAQYDWCSFITAADMSYGSVTRMVTSGVGMIGIAQGAIVEGKFGWFQVGGIGWANSAGVSAATLALYACGTTAHATGSVIGGDLIAGAFSVGTGAKSGGTVKVLISNPYQTNTLS